MRVFTERITAVGSSDMIFSCWNTIRMKISAQLSDQHGWNNAFLKAHLRGEEPATIRQNSNAVLQWGAFIPHCARGTWAVSQWGLGIGVSGMSGTAPPAQSFPALLRWDLANAQHPSVGSNTQRCPWLCSDEWRGAEARLIQAGNAAFYLFVCF